MDVIDDLARGFAEVTISRRFGGDRSQDIGRLSLDQAYLVQEAAAELKEQAGLSRWGWKVGCTSPAIRSQLGLKEPIQAPMYRPLIHDEGREYDRAEFLNLAIEPELVICLGQDLPRPPSRPEELIPAIDWVAPGIELHHKQFFFEPVSSQELIASGGLWAGLVVGRTRVVPTGIDLAGAEFSVAMDGRSIARAPGRDIMGGPMISLLWLADRLADQGRPLKKGDLVIPGSPTELIQVDRSTRLSVEIQGVGQVEARFN